MNGKKNSIYPFIGNSSQNLCWPPSQIGFYLLLCMVKLCHTEMPKKDFGVKRCEPKSSNFHILTSVIFRKTH